MSDTDLEIIVDDPTAPEDNSPAVTSNRSVDIVVSLLLLAFAATLGYDNWRTGVAWDETGPQPGYFPFYLSVILGAASLYGISAALLSRKEALEAFVTRAQFRRVMAVFVPTFLFCLVTQFLGLYVASFLLITGFMRLVGKIAMNPHWEIAEFEHRPHGWPHARRCIVGRKLIKESDPEPTLSCHGTVCLSSLAHEPSNDAGRGVALLRWSRRSGAAHSGNP